MFPVTVLNICSSYLFYIFSQALGNVSVFIVYYNLKDGKVGISFSDGSNKI